MSKNFNSCECGSQHFFAYQMEQKGIIVDSNNDFYEDLVETKYSVFDIGAPIGPYQCVKCGKERESLLSLPTIGGEVGLSSS